MPTDFRNSFSAGYIDPLMYSRVDIRKWKAACVEMTNVITLPQGGFTRRPGTKYVATYPSGRILRLRPFRVGYSTQYLLVFAAGATPSSLATLDVYDTNDALLTSMNLPYTALQFAGLGFAQELDTMVMFHPNVAPHRLLRSTLESDEIGDPAATRGPLETTSGSPNVLVRHIDHGLLTGDEVGFSGASAIGGLAASDLNRQHQVTGISGTITTDSVVCTELTRNVTITVGSNHGFVAGERIDIKGLESIVITDLIDTDNFTALVIPADELNRVQIITATGATTVTFQVATTVPLNFDTASGLVSLGGDGGTWRAIDKYYVTHSGMPNATSTVTAGGGSPLVWSLSSLAPNASRKVALTNIPKFNYKDANSPQPANEVQNIIFQDMAPGNRYRTELEGSSGSNSGFGTLEYEADNNTNAAVLQDRLNAQARRSGITVEYDAIASDAAGSGYDVYRVTFDGDASTRNWDTIIITVTQSTSGTASVETLAQGGSTEEDVWSDLRGWPRAGVFHQRRLWMVASASRPLTVWASIPEDFFNFEVADQQPADAIDNTGQFDPIRDIVVGSTGLHLLTIGDVVDIVPDRDTGGYQHPLNFKTGDSVGATGQAPVVLAGLVLYVDNIERGIRQIRFDEADRLISAEVSLFAQPLIRTPVNMATLRDGNGDYLYVVNTDGTIACLCLDVPQRVLGWSLFELSGDNSFLDVAEAGGFMYAAIEHSAGRYLVKFDPAYFTDAGVIQTDSDQTAWSGLDHLDGDLCDVRGDEATLDQATPASGAIVSKAAGVEYPCDELEVGLPFDLSVQPTPPVVGRKTRLYKAVVDVYRSREFSVGGYPVVTRNSASLVNPPPLVDGLWPVPLRGWGQRKTVAITQRAPQPLTVRGLQMEAA